MPNRVAIVEVAQMPGSESSENFLDQVYRVSKEVLDKAGISREDVGTVVSASSDVFHGGVSCANAYYWDSGGGFLKNGSRQDGESLLAFIYAVMRILTGHYHKALVVLTLFPYIILNLLLFPLLLNYQSDRYSHLSHGTLHLDLTLLLLNAYRIPLERMLLPLLLQLFLLNLLKLFSSFSSPFFPLSV